MENDRANLKEEELSLFCFITENYSTFHPPPPKNREKNWFLSLVTFYGILIRFQLNRDYFVHFCLIRGMRVTLQPKYQNRDA